MTARPIYIGIVALMAFAQVAIAQEATPSEPHENNPEDMQSVPIPQGDGQQEQDGERLPGEATEVPPAGSQGAGRGNSAQPEAAPSPPPVHDKKD